MMVANLILEGLKGLGQIMNGILNIEIRLFSLNIYQFVAMLASMHCPVSFSTDAPG